MGTAAFDLNGFVQAYAQRLRQRIRVERILLFGSYARGEALANSDLDLLVVSPDFGRDYLQNVVLLQSCLPPREVLIDVDTVARTPEEVASVEPDSFLATILAEAVLLFEARPGTPARL